LRSGSPPKSSRQWATTVRYQALFADAGGIATGNDVTVSGIKVGSVTDMSLQRGEVLMNVHRQRERPARVGQYRTHQDRLAVGQRVLTLESAGGGTLRPMAVIR